jgi:hypothetical protein
MVDGGESTDDPLRMDRANGSIPVWAHFFELRSAALTTALKFPREARLDRDAVESASPAS